MEFNLFYLLVGAFAILIMLAFAGFYQEAKRCDKYKDLKISEIPASR